MNLKIPRRRTSLTTHYVIIVGLLLFAANIVLGIVMMNQSKAMMRTMINKNMLDVSNTAAGLLDGDALSALTEEDVGGPVFEDIKQKLFVFQKNADIEFIYAVRQLDEDTYVFTVDPDPVNPGEFGEEVVVTEALIQAAKGFPSVDSAPAADEWGNFYSAYSPVFDSKGKVAGVVGVDFGAEWYDAQVRQHTLSIGIISVFSVVLGAVVMILITGKVRRKFEDLDSNLSALAKNVDELTEELTSNLGYKDSLGGEASTGDAVPLPVDEIESLTVKIHAMQREMERYLAYVHMQAYTDPLTHVGNSNAYQEELRAIEQQIESGEADFGVVFFDIDNLKIANDRYGHACGDRIIRGAGEAIAKIFGKEHTFRVGGDEFIAIPCRLSEQEIEALLGRIEAAVAAFNSSPDHPEAHLSLSLGAAVYRRGVDTCFRDVFVRADEAMYVNKGEHHRLSSLQVI